MEESSKTYQESDWLSVGDVAREFGVTVATVRNWDKAGRITAVRTPSGHRRFSKADVARLREAGTSTTEAKTVTR